MSNNLNLPQVTSTQLQKDVTINEQADILDAALTEEYILVGDVSPTLTAEEFAENMTFTNDGAQTALNTLTVPSSQKKLFLVDNKLSGFDLDVVKGATTVTVSAGTSQLFYADGTANGLKEHIPEVNILVPTFTGFAAGAYTSAEIIMNWVATSTFRLQQDLPTSQAFANTAPTAAASLPLKKNGSSIGSIDFAAGQNVATFTFSADVDFVAGDYITVEAPSVVDATLADVSVALISIVL